MVTYILVNIDPGIPAWRTKLLPEPMLTYHQ